MSTNTNTASVKSLLVALTDAFECLDDDNDIEGAVSDLNTMQELLRKLLPASGVYAWVCDGMDARYVRVFSSAKEAEEKLNLEINEKIEDLDDFDAACTVPHRNTLQKNGIYEITVRDGYGCVIWKRMYDPTGAYNPNK